MSKKKEAPPLFKLVQDKVYFISYDKSEVLVGTVVEDINCKYLNFDGSDITLAPTQLNYLSTFMHSIY